MNWLPDETLRHLRAVADLPDLTGTRYDLRERVARGGMGTVYRVWDRELQRDVALKVLTAPLSSSVPMEQWMRRETRVLARLEHPGIVPIHDVGTLPDGRLYYTMKFVRGERLDSLAGPDTGLSERLRIFERICETVAFAHAQGVVHRDLKPQNIMVGPFGEVLVLDWGVAKLRGGPAEEGTLATPAPAPGDTAPGTVVGTPGYMAPEQARGESHAVDERTDVYGLGAILRQLITGRSPDGPEDGGGPRGIPRALAAVVHRATAVDPAARYPTAADLSADIARYREGLAVSAYEETLLDRLGRFARKYRTPILLILAYLLMRIVLLLTTRV